MRTDLYWVSGPWPGRLAIMPRPRGDDWLEDEVRSWQRSGVDVALSLLTPDEIAELGLADEAELCRANDIQYLSFPIADRGVPSSKVAFLELLTRLVEDLRGGKGIVVHCRQGIGRAGLIAVCLLILAGIDPETAIQRVSMARGCPVPETLEQRRWITEFVKGSRAQSPK
jgi:protein-tyrosine phosphatase